MRSFYGDLLCECDSIEFERIALTTSNSLMVVSHVLVICVSCSIVFSSETDPHVEDLELLPL